MLARAKSLYVGGNMLELPNEVGLKQCRAPAIADSAPAAQPTLTSAAIGSHNSDPLSAKSFLASWLQRWPFGIMLHLARQLLQRGAVAATAQ